MSHKTTLLPCPFCGGEARLVNDYSSEKGMSYQIWHECTGHEGRSGGYGQGVKPFFETPWYATDAEAISAWNTRATHGTLTAEQVREAVEASSWAETSTIREFNDSSWQAIADELNAELGSGTCKLIADLQEDKRTKTGYKLACIHCSACGEQHSGSICFREDGSYVIYRDEQDIFCRHCGSMITNDVDELSKAVKR